MTVTPVLTRIAVGKALGVLFGGLIAWMLARTGSVAPHIIWGSVAWSLTMGALIGVIGYYNHIPLIERPLPAWLRGAWIGLWMGLVFVLLSFAALKEAVAAYTWLPVVLRTPWVLLIDAAAMGAVIDIFATRVAGRTNWPGSGVSLPP
ncbi:MAG: hypothetical protein AAGP08_18390 [Pseudomonadota bacterium]